VPKITPEYIDRMNAILDLYELPYNLDEPVIGLDMLFKIFYSNILKYPKLLLIERGRHFVVFP